MFRKAATASMENRSWPRRRRSTHRKRIIESVRLLTWENIVESRLDFAVASPEAMRAMVALETAVAKLGIERSLYELVKLRASQITGRAFCVDMHTTDALEAGETASSMSAVVAGRKGPRQNFRH